MSVGNHEVLYVGRIQAHFAQPAYDVLLGLLPVVKGVYQDDAFAGLDRPGRDRVLTDEIEVVHHFQRPDVAWLLNAAGDGPAVVLIDDTGMGKVRVEIQPGNLLRFLEVRIHRVFVCVGSRYELGARHSCTHNGGEQHHGSAQ